MEHPNGLNNNCGTRPAKSIGTPIEIVKKAILREMRNWNKDLHPDVIGMWGGYHKLSRQTGFSRPILKKAMKSLAEDGKVELKYTSSDISRVAGSGWFLT